MTFVTTRILLGTPYTALRERAVEAAADHATDSLQSVLWLDQNAHLSDQVPETWSAERFALSLEFSDLSSFVGEAYDAQTGPATGIDALTRRQIVEEALRSDPVAELVPDAHRLRRDVLELTNGVEGEGYDTPAAVRNLIADSDLTPTAAEFVEQTTKGYTEGLETVLTEVEYTDRAAYRAAVDGDVSIPEALNDVDVIVLSNYYELTTPEWTVVQEIADTVPLIVTLPLVTHFDELPDGPDAVAAETVSRYLGLVDERDAVTWVDGEDSDGASDDLRRVSETLYRPTPDVHAIDDETLRWFEAPTPDREVEQVARDLRQRIATDPQMTQGDVMMIVPGLLTYRERIADSFEAAGLTPAQVTNVLLFHTYAGRAMLDLVELCTDDDPNAVLYGRLASNPLVDCVADGSAVTRTVRALPTTDPDRLFSELGDADAEALRDVREAAAEVTETSGVAVVDAVRGLFERMGLGDRLEAIEQPFDTDFERAMERRAYRRVQRALDAVERVVRENDDSRDRAPRHDSDRDVLERVADELDNVRVPPPSQSFDDVIEVGGGVEALGRNFDHLYFVGLTASDYPPEPERPWFFEDLYDGLADDGVAPIDRRALTRYQFATMLASAKTARIFTPERTSAGDSMLPSPVLDELQRVTGIEPETPSQGRATAEDVQFAVGRSPDVDPTDAVDRAIEAGVFDGGTADRVHHGVACATHRAAPERSEYDGQVDPGVVAEIYPPSDRRPYSPSRLGAYAKCGFRFAMERILELEEPIEFELEPTPLDHGNLVHGTLRRFYRRLQSEPGERVDLSEYTRVRLEREMLVAAEDTLEAMDLPYEGGFFERWVEARLAGLATPHENPYYGDGSVGSGESIHADADGLLAQFITEERDRDTSRLPGWFEVQMDLTEPPNEDRSTTEDEDTVTTADDDSGIGGRISVETPTGPIPVRGQLDRVTLDRTESPSTAMVQDYKSSYQSAGDDVDGISFQLSLYALAAGRELPEEVSTPVDSQYYTVSLGHLGTHRSLRSSVENRDGANSEDHRRLVEEETPARLSRIEAGVEGGAFHPTVLDARTAGCRHCNFSDVCDVRYHMRRTVAEAVAGDDRPGYVPDAAHSGSFLDTEAGGRE